MMGSCPQQVNTVPDTLPPLNALRAFVAAARHENFLEAGQELNVSPGTISRHVKTLEGFLNSNLFLHCSNGVRLTSAGQIYLEKIEPILTTLSEATQSFVAETEDQVLVVSTLPIFAEKWLGPHLPAFRNVVKRVSSPPIGALIDCFSAIREGQFSALNNRQGRWRGDGQREQHRSRPGVRPAEVAGSSIATQRGMAYGLLERPERRQVPCRAPGDEARAVTEAADVDRQGADEADGQASRHS